MAKDRAANARAVKGRAVNARAVKGRAVNDWALPRAKGALGQGGMARQVARPVVLVDEHSKTAKFKFASRREAARAVGSSKCVLSRLCQANARAFDAVHGLSLSPPLSLSLSLSLCLSVSVSLSLSLSLSLCRACARSLSLLRARSLSRAPSPCAGGLNVQG